MEKFDSNKHSKLTKRLPFSYFSTPLYLDHNGYIIRRNGEDVIVWQDLFYKHEYPAIFLPNKIENLERCSISLATQEDINTLIAHGVEVLVTKPGVAEFYYRTSDFTEPQGSLRKKINLFAKNYQYTILHEYDKKKVQRFFRFWRDQRERTSPTFIGSSPWFDYCLENLERYDIKQVYIEINNKLVGFAWGMKHGKNWIGLHLKVDYKYKGLSRFLHHERAKLFAKLPEFTIGTGGREVGIENYKRELGPIEERNYFYILTGDIRREPVI